MSSFGLVHQFLVKRGTKYLTSRRDHKEGASTPVPGTREPLRVEQSATAVKIKEQSPSNRLVLTTEPSSCQAGIKVRVNEVVSST